MPDYSARFKHYLTGISKLDDQHWVVVKQLQDCIHVTYDTPEQASATLRDAITHLKSHFSSEEALMTAVKYPIVERHKMDHTTIQKAAENILSLLDNNNVPDLLFKVKSLNEAFIVHIDQHDIQFADWVRSNSSNVDH